MSLCNINNLSLQIKVRKILFKKSFSKTIFLESLYQNDIEAPVLKSETKALLGYKIICAAVLNRLFKFVSRHLGSVLLCCFFVAMEPFQ